MNLQEFHLVHSLSSRHNPEQLNVLRGSVIDSSQFFPVIIIFFLALLLGYQHKHKD